MQYKNLGHTGLKVSRICLGTNMMGGYVDQEACIRVIDACEEHGVNFVDTANVYNEGRSEEFIGKSVKGRRRQFILTTKVAMTAGPGVNDRGASRRHILDSVEHSLRRLDTDYIDLYLVHRWDRRTPLEETLRTLDDLVSEGKVRYIGCSNFAAWQLCKALWTSDKLGLERFEAVQPLYNLRSREIEGELIPLCADQQIGVIPYQVLMGGMLSGRYARTPEPPEGTHMASAHARGTRDLYWKEESFQLADRMKDMAGKVGCSTAQLAVAGALANPAVTSVVVGASTPQQVTENARAVDITLTPQQLGAINGF